MAHICILGLHGIIAIKQDGSLNEKTVQATILDFLKNFLSKNVASYQNHLNAKRRLNIVGYFQNYFKKI
jgi:hypothetical protein